MKTLKRIIYNLFHSKRIAERRRKKEDDERVRKAIRKAIDSDGGRRISEMIRENRRKMKLEENCVVENLSKKKRKKRQKKERKAREADRKDSFF